MRQATRRLGGRRHGVELLETAFTLVVLMSLVFGGVEFGYYMFVKHALQTACREGARTAVLSGSSNTTVNNAVASAMGSAGLLSSGYVVTTTPTSVSTATSGSQITVTVSCTWGTVGAAFRPLALISASKSMSVSVVMVKEG